MRMFVANCTKQNVMFNYRLPEGRRPYSQQIGSGQQVQISSDLSLPDINAIVGQTEQYGMVRLEELEARPDGLVSFLCAIDKPVPWEAIRRVMLQNHARHREAGEQRRKEMAVAVSDMLGQHNKTAGESLEIEIEEEKTGTMDHGDDGRFERGYRVDPGSEEGDKRSRRRRSKR